MTLALHLDLCPLCKPGDYCPIGYKYLFAAIEAGEFVGGVAELADAGALNASGVNHAGSSPVAANFNVKGCE